jgi:hypothetical protein
MHDCGRWRRCIDILDKPVCTRPSLPQTTEVDGLICPSERATPMTIRIVHDVIEQDPRTKLRGDSRPSAPTDRKPYIHDSKLSREDDEKAWEDEIDRQVAEELKKRAGK